MKPMTIKELLTTAAKGYSDGGMDKYITKSGTLNKSATGDTLAKFIVVELIETFDPKAPLADQVDTAIEALEKAVEELHGVIDVLRVL
jgi:hypothetical protein